MTQVIRIARSGNSPEDARAEEIALALMGVGRLDPEALAEAATWDGASGLVEGATVAVAGRLAIVAALDTVAPPEKIRVEQVVAHGRAGSVSGRITRGGETRLYCHFIRFTSPAARQVAQLVSFEHPGGK
jgi:hypothetical protein